MFSPFLVLFVKLQALSELVSVLGAVGGQIAERPLLRCDGLLPSIGLSESRGQGVA